MVKIYIFELTTPICDKDKPFFLSELDSSEIKILPNQKGKDLIKALKKQINSGETLNGEYYVGPSFNYLIEDGYSIFPLPVLAKYVLGDVENIRLFEKRNLTVTDLLHKCKSDF